MNDTNKLAKIYELIKNAESSIELAKQLMGDIAGISDTSKISKGQYTEKAAEVSSDSGDGGRIIEGVFDGQNMIDKKGTVFPIPANYASKSKLIPGDVLKLTITEEGKFLYKQIGPVERKTVIGPLVCNEGQYQILANGKAYNVLLASVTYFRAQVGDEVTLIIPLNEDADWGAIEAALPKFGEGVNIEEEKTSTKKTRKTKKEVDLEEELDI